MNTFRALISLFVVSVLLLLWPYQAGATDRISKERITEFNEEIFQAVGRDEMLSCSPINLAAKFLGKLSIAGETENQFNCTGTETDSYTVVSVRSESPITSNGGHWVELGFEKMENNGWWLVSVETIKPSPKPHLNPQSSSKKNEGSHTGSESSTFFKNESSEVSVEMGGVRMTLKNQLFSSRGCEPREIGTVIGSLAGNRPSPYSVPQMGFCLGERAEIAVTISKGRTSETQTFDFGWLNPSLYMVEIEWGQLGPGGHIIQVWCNNTLTNLKFAKVN